SGLFATTIELGQRYERVGARLDRGRQRLDEIFIERKWRAIPIAVHGTQHTTPGAANCNHRTLSPLRMPRGYSVIPHEPELEDDRVDRAVAVDELGADAHRVVGDAVGGEHV